MSNKVFQYYQPNKKDLKDTKGDCVIRALTKVLNKDWFDVFDDLIPYAKANQCMPNDKDVLKDYLLTQNFKYVGVSNKKGTVRPTVESFTKQHKTGTYILIVAHHVVASIDGHYYDTWDSGCKSLYGYWEKI